MNKKDKQLLQAVPSNIYPVIKELLERISKLEGYGEPVVQVNEKNIKETTNK